MKLKIVSSIVFCTNHEKLLKKFQMVKKLLKYLKNMFSNKEVQNQTIKVR